MNTKGFLRAHVCLTATTTALFAGTTYGGASASQIHTLKHGQTVDYLSRHYHVGINQILTANHLNANDVLRDGRTLYIPDAPQPVNVPHTMRRVARIKGDRISVRIGPASTHHRLRLCDSGASLIVTAEQTGWLQVTLADGRCGWVRSDFVQLAGSAPRPTVARRERKTKQNSATPSMLISTSAGTMGKHNLRTLTGNVNPLAHKQHEGGPPSADAIARMRERTVDSAAAALRRRHVEAAATRRGHHAMATAAASQRSHARQVAEHRLAEAGGETQRHERRVAEAAATLHRKHTWEVAEARRHSQLKLVAQARHDRHAREIAEAQHHTRMIEVAQNRHHESQAKAEAEHHAAKQSEIARAHHINQLHAIALGTQRRHEQELGHARRQRHLDELAAARYRHHLAALSNAYRRHFAAVEAHNRRAALAAAGHSSSRSYTHRYRPEAASPSVANDVVRTAFAYRGTPYRWGMSRPGGFDCSGFTKYVYARKGVALPRTAAEQYHAGNAVSHLSMKPGDLVFFHTTRRGISHVGMYVGNGKFVHSSSKKSGGVRVDNLDSGYYSHAFRGARRVRKETSEPSGE